MHKEFLYRLTKLFCIFLVGTWIFIINICVQPTYAQSSAADSNLSSISRVEIRGNQRIEAQTIRTYMTVVPGDRVDGVSINQTLKRLFETGLFADVSVALEGRTLVVNVVENPIINRVAFEGNKVIKNDDLNDTINLRPRIVYTRSRIQESAQRLVQLYQSKGRWGVVIDPKIIRLEQNRVDVVLEIDEGDVTSIRKINFIGNKKYSDGDLRDEISSREDAWWRFLSSSNRYDPDRLNYDRELLRRFYLNNGYADFSVKSAVAELTPDRQDFFLTFNLEEGNRFRVGEIKIESSIEDLDTDVLARWVATKSGSIYSAERVDDSILNMTFEVGKLGYAFVEIKPDLDVDRDSDLINITYVIEEGPRVYVERINIEGNVRTLDKVIRREFRLVEGDAFNTAKIQRSQQRIRALGFFSDVQLKTEEGTAADKSILTVRVEERSTGNLSFGAGYSSDSGASASASIRERNLLGRGQDLSLSFSLSGNKQIFDLSFTEPYFLDRELAAGFDIYNVVTDNQKKAGYNQKVSGGRLRTGFPYNETLFQRLSYTLQETEITKISAKASEAVKKSEGRALVSELGQTIIYDIRDSRGTSQHGLVVSFSSAFAGLGGDKKYLKNSVRQDYSLELFEDVDFSFRTGAGAVIGIGKDVSISDRYRLGGSTLRGFEDGGIGPRDISTNTALGGDYFARTSIEIAYPLPVTDDYGLKGRVFVDSGSAWGLSGTGNNVNIKDDFFAVRASTGLGITWNSPFGPITADYGIPLAKKSYDVIENFRFDFGTTF